MKRNVRISQYVGKALTLGLIVSAVSLPAMVNGQELPDVQQDAVIEEGGSTEIAVDEAASEIPVTAAYFPDVYFRKYISQNVDTDKNGKLSSTEINAFTTATLSGNYGMEGQWTGTVEGPVKDLAGIEYLTNLKHLEINIWEGPNACLKQVSLIQNKELTYLSVISGVDELDISGNTKLTYLDCSGNKLTNLDVSKNTKLESLNCMNNQLTSIEVNNHSKLSVLFISNNPISTINIDNLPKLQAISYGYTKIKKLDLTPYQNQLVTIGCDGLGLKSLDVSVYPELVMLTCSDNQLTSLDLSKNPKLSVVSCQNNKLAYLDVSQNKKFNPEYSQEGCLFDVGNNTYSVAFDDNAQLDLSKIPGFRVDKVSNLKGGKISGTVLTLNSGSNKVTYTYDCGFTYKGEKLQTAEFAIKNTNPSSVTPTEAFCSRLYTLCLGRSADQAGIDYWTAQLENGSQTGASVGYNFVFSAEYIGKNTSDEAFVKMLYEVFMNRSADQGGLNYWVDLLQQGVSREYVYKGFAESQEYTNICNSYGIVRGSVKLKQARDYNVNMTKYVSRIYEKALNRKGDADGLNYWCGQMQTKAKTPVQVAESFFFAPEFTNKNLSDAEYVKVLYRTFMGREYDQGGLDYWVGRLNKGESRKSVLESFAGCQEFKNIVKGFGL